MSGQAERKPNRLIHEKSPYLLQHAYNPVNWYPWGDEAFEKAKREDKPIFLSIGYSTCHWCHVMERESFDDEEVAAILNRDFVAIKVDREERPDIDQIYMMVCQAMTGHGGWPLTIIMTPDKKPFFAGTYFPKRGRYGRPGLLDILERIAEVWKHDRTRIDRVSQNVLDAVQPHFQNRPGELDAAVLDEAYRQFAERFDAQYGGFGPPPKFPTPHNLIFLLRYGRLTGNAHATAMATKTLDAMHRGGIYDHIGFGFARYSTDREWLVPHFEKMLYDNALLAYAYLEAYEATGEAWYARVAREIFAYVEREMTDPGGGFYSAQDADSEGVEGKFYVWTPEEVKAVLGAEEGALFCDVYDITPGGNFEGKSIPNLIHTSLESAARRYGMTTEEMEKRLEAMRQRLFAARAQRVPPHKDDKILTAWCALMIAALAKGAKVLDEPALADRAKQAASFLFAKLRRRDGRLLARYRDGEAAHLAYLDDYAFLVWALLELYEATFEVRFLRDALELARQMFDLFWDDQDGGLFFTGRDAEALIARPKEVYDGATPSGNSVAAYTLVRLAQLTGDEALRRQADAQLQAFAGDVRAHPSAHAFFLLALLADVAPSVQVVVVGRTGAPDTEAMWRAARKVYAPQAVILLVPEGEEARAEVEALAPFVAGMRMVDGKATAYLCRHFACQAPTTDPEEVARELSQVAIASD
ncbi:thioredoxin domain-containing protein [Calditerricola satsumensis]|uniref:Spermatogenesis-associated protein 20-like TRX domain-containing protein n=1 Tax=Calditerricola satsumensis TaxID=373054 RepID=A0A8J3BG08_9BACI|nr:thioredoxin domain-containing protein [Calditerricola satsumensis]GGK07858.1 hypothetical protein GCM10007043_22390 [Calditerricola satsumensis]